MNEYEYAKERYFGFGVDTESVIKKLDEIPISLHCWQGDDVRGFEDSVLDEASMGGIRSTGNYPGRANSPDELRKNIDSALKLIPGTVKLNLHAIYGDIKGIDRDKIQEENFKSWLDWAKIRNMGLDFNPTMFAHPKATDGLTLCHPDREIRKFWIEHCKRCRRISEYFGRETKKLSVMNLWIADGFKDTPADTLTPRMRLRDCLDEIFEVKSNPDLSLDALESKLFGIGLESYTAGSHEFYLAYAVKNDLAICLDTGHFHPTELVSAKISAVSLFINKILLHVSRPVRWDSDHVVSLNDELTDIAKELTRHNLLERVHIGLDYFDGSIDRIIAWVTGMRNMRKALLIALLEPFEILKSAELEFNFTKRLAMTEELKTLPWASVWNEYCRRKNVAEFIKV